jgi:hypothetical protein
MRYTVAVQLWYVPLTLCGLAWLFTATEHSITNFNFSVFLKAFKVFNFHPLKIQKLIELLPVMSISENQGTVLTFLV